MKCPHCDLPLSRGKCSHCGWVSTALRGGAGEEPDLLGQKSIRFDVHTQAAKPEAPAGEDWRTELKRKLSRRAEKSRELPEAATAPPASTRANESIPLAEPAAPSAQEERPLFKYRMGQPQPQKPERRIVTFSKKMKPVPATLEKPLIRTMVRPSSLSREPEPVRQRHLNLEGPGGEAEAAGMPGEEFLPPVEVVSREVLFSRLLAGIIDLSLALVAGTTFALSAALILEVDLLSADLLQWGGFFSLAFFFFNSFFFFATSGQTPGMYLTDLGLVSDGGESDEISAMALLSRVILFLPVVLTGVGLLWSLFDSRRRCFHDLLSGTRIVPLDPTRP